MGRACRGPWVHPRGTAGEDRLRGAARHGEAPGVQCAPQPVFVERPGEGQALAVGAAHGAQRGDLFEPVHTVCHGAQAEIGGDPQQTAGDLVQPGGVDDAFDEGAVKFQPVDRESSEAVERGVSAAEAVQGDSDAMSAQGREAAFEVVQRNVGSLPASSTTRAPDGSP